MIGVFAFLFSNLALGALFALGGIAALVHVAAHDLPDHDELVNYQPPMLSRVYSGEGRVIAEYARERRVFAPVEEIPDLVKNAFISAEDKNFYTHPGIDPTGIVKAMGRFVLARVQGRPARITGASTITQQVMKNFLVGNARSVERKIREAVLAVRVSSALSKDDILELYLNDIYLGEGAYGVAAAAERYFAKPLEALTPPEAAYLAALPKAPSDLHPVEDRARAKERRAYVLEEMAQNGHLSRRAAEAAKDARLETVLDDSLPRRVTKAEPNYFTAEVRRQMIGEVGEDALYTGGLTARATIDPELQAIAQRVLRTRLVEFDRERGVYHGPYRVIAEIAEGRVGDWRALLAGTRLPRDIEGWHPAVVLETGATTALVGIEGLEGEGTARISLAEEDWIEAIDRDDARRGAPRRPSDLWRPGDVIYVTRADSGEGWRMRQIPKVEGAFMAMDPHTGRVMALQGGFSYEHSVFNRATQAERQPGSAFKPFVYAAALDAGYSPATIVLDAPVVVRLPDGDWRPKNSSGKFYGPAPLRLGLILSRNLMTVRIAQQIGMDRVADYAERFGVYNDMPNHLSYALGAGETSLYQMIAAYGMFANGGKRVQPTVIDRIQDRHGDTMFRHDPRHCEGCRAETYRPDARPVLYDTRSQIMNPATARQLVSMMQGVVREGTAARTVGDLGFPVAGKTGTTNESRDAWFVGFSPNLVAGCWIGYDNPQSMGRAGYGGTLCGPVFKRFMTEAMQGREPGRFDSLAASEVVTVKIDRETGERLPDDAVGAHVVVETFQKGTEPELFETAAALQGDAALFGGDLGDLPFELTPVGQDEPLPLGEERAGAAQASTTGDTGQSAGDAATRAPTSAPTPPQGGDLGLGTGGLY